MSHVGISPRASPSAPFFWRSLSVPSFTVVGCEVGGIRQLNGPRQSTLELETRVSALSRVVRCRDRIWAVNEVTPSSSPPDAPRQLRRDRGVSFAAY